MLSVILFASYVLIIDNNCIYTNGHFGFGWTKIQFRESVLINDIVAIDLAYSTNNSLGKKNNAIPNKLGASCLFLQIHVKNHAKPNRFFSKRQKKKIVDMLEKNTNICVENKNLIYNK